jgi:hypothetical protein
MISFSQIESGVSRGAEREVDKGKDATGGEDLGLLRAVQAEASGESD